MIFLTIFIFLGLSVILISRTKEKLEQVAKEIQSKSSNIQVKTIPIDFTRKIYNSIIKQYINTIMQSVSLSIDLVFAFHTS